jgi:glycosyltransferase involved in cell wall biosynthesis
MRWLNGRSNRRCRFSYLADLVTSKFVNKLILTAHNLLPHDVHAQLDRLYYATTFRLASKIIVHSEKARECLLDTVHIPADRIEVIPHGDLAVGLPAPIKPLEARRRIGFHVDYHYVLAFGRLAPYKGYCELVEFWGRLKTDLVLVLAGEATNPEFIADLGRLAEKAGPKVRLLTRRLEEKELAFLLQGAACVVFNYTRVFTSGAACLARSLGVPILLPKRLGTVDLAEPSPLVFRFESLETDFADRLAAAVKTPANYEYAEMWRQETAWSRVAEATVRAYKS